MGTKDLPRIQILDVVRGPHSIYALYLVAPKVAMRVRRFSWKPHAGEIVAFLQDAWAEGYGGGAPGILVLDGAVVNFDRRIREFCLESGVVIRSPQLCDQIEDKLKGERHKIDEGATP